MSEMQARHRCRVSVQAVRPYCTSCVLTRAPGPAEIERARDSLWMDFPLPANPGMPQLHCRIAPMLHSLIFDHSKTFVEVGEAAWRVGGWMVIPCMDAFQ